MSTEFHREPLVLRDNEEKLRRPRQVRGSALRTGSAFTYLRVAIITEVVARVAGDLHRQTQVGLVHSQRRVGRV